MSGNDPYDPLAHPAAGTAAPEAFHVGYRRGWRRLRGRLLLTLDGHGITSHAEHLTVPWPDVPAVRVEPGGRAVLFGPITIHAHDLGTDLEALLTAVHRFTDAPIHQRYPGH